MKKIIVVAIIFMFSNSYATILTCPESIRCEYLTGSCFAQKNENKHEWTIYTADAKEKFSGSQFIKIHLAIVFDPAKNARLVCGYDYGNKGSRFLLTSKKKIKSSLITDNWTLVKEKERGDFQWCKPSFSADECQVEVNEL